MSDMCISRYCLPPLNVVTAELYACLWVTQRPHVILISFAICCSPTCLFCAIAVLDCCIYNRWGFSFGLSSVQHCSIASLWCNSNVI